MSSETPPSIPPRKKPTEKSGAKPDPVPTVAKPSTGGTGTGGANRPTTGTASASSSEASAPSARTTGTATATATQQPVRPATAATPAPAATAAPTARPAGSGDAAPTPRPAARSTVPAAAASSGPRRVRLAISRVDPWSVMKLSFLVSVAVGIMLVVATAVLWLALDGLHVFSSINDLVTEVLADSEINLMQYVEFDRVISVATLIAVVDVFLITALSTIGAFLYNITAALVGGVHVTMTDE